MKKYLIFIILLTVVGLLGLVSCGGSESSVSTPTTSTTTISTTTSTSTTTTTTTTSTTTTTTTSTSTSTTTGTTLASYSINGTIDGLEFGTLQVVVCTLETLADNAFRGSMDYNIATAETFKNYSYQVTENGTYYVMGTLYVGRWNVTTENPATGDKIGTHGTGKITQAMADMLPQSFEASDIDEADPAEVSNADANNMSFTLSVTVP